MDKIIIEIDKILKTLTSSATSTRPHPDELVLEEELLSKTEKKHSLGLMRVNHCGEVCAQALYQGQALTSRDKSNRVVFENAAFEEIEHLAWTERRIRELGGQPSIFNPFFYFASLTMGVLAGKIGDKWSLGFLEETEHQVEQHLKQHQSLLSSKDKKSLAIVSQMQLDESKHAQMANEHGASRLPGPVKLLMAALSKVMTKATYYL